LSLPAIAAVVRSVIALAAKGNGLQPCLMIMA